MGGGDNYFWLGASADADPATRASHGAASASPPSGECPLRMDEYLLAFRDLVIACVAWADVSDEILAHYPVEEMEAAFDLLNPIFGETVQ